MKHYVDRLCESRRNMKKIDIHSHILPGVDDGAKDEKQSLEMLKLAAADGITDIIATPHFHYRRGHATPAQIKAAAAKCQQLIKDAGLNINIYTGNELYYTHELLETVKAGEALTMADSDYVLLEFSPDTERRKIQNAVYQFLSEDYYPIIAHMERYMAFQKHPDFAYAISDMGTYFQLNAGSLLGTAGWSTKRFSRAMLKSGMIHFIGTDTHDIKNRPPQLEKALTWLEKKFGEDEALQYVSKNPQMILKNEAI